MWLDPEPSHDGTAKDDQTHHHALQVTSTGTFEGPSSPTTVPQRSHKALDNAGGQIRLLKARPESCAIPSFNTSVWNLDSAPRYVAISYTWGDADMQKLSIDGVETHVRQSAFHALWQVVQHYPRYYIWIDSVCINQHDDHEKSLQVPMMFQIYGKATVVTARLGDHVDDSDWLAATITALEPVCRGLARQYHLSAEDMFRGGNTAAKKAPIWPILFQVFDHARLAKALNALALRPYWRRLWIVQEMAAARQEVQLLCGSSRFSPFAVFMLLEALSQTFEDPFDYAGGSRGRSHPVAMMQSIVNYAGNNLDQRETLSNNLATFGEMLCLDPRDRLYGTFSLTDWELSGCQPILPDYSRSIWELALMLASVLELNELDLQLRAFSIDAGHENMLLAVCRQRRDPDMQENCIRGPHESRITKRLGSRWGDTLVRCVQLKQSGPGILTADLFARHEEHYYSAALIEHWQFVVDNSNAESLFRNVQRVYVEDTLAALLCPGPLPGDLLVPVGFYIRGLLLVVRRQPGRNDLCDIIGQGILLNCYAPEPWELKHGQRLLHRTSEDLGSGCSIFYADVMVTLTAEEALVLLGQDLEGNWHGGYSVAVAKGAVSVLNEVSFPPPERS